MFLGCLSGPRVIPEHLRQPMLLANFFNRSCLCGRHLKSGLICSDCLNGIIKNTSKFGRCFYCGRPSVHNLSHSHCLNRRRFLGGEVMFDYGQLTKRLVINLKYGLVRNKITVVDFLVKKWFHKHNHPLISSWRSQPSIFIPVASHKTRLNWRGFDLPTTICQSLSSLTKIPTIPALKRNRPTRLRLGLSRKQRFKNLFTVFRLGTEIKHQVSRVNNAILVDDVVTTGATLTAAAWPLTRFLPYVKLWFVCFTRQS